LAKKFWQILGKNFGGIGRKRIDFLAPFCYHLVIVPEELALGELTSDKAAGIHFR
jgi:hypothetical protein